MNDVDYHKSQAAWWLEQNANTVQDPAEAASRAAAHASLAVVAMLEDAIAKLAALRTDPLKEPSAGWTPPASGGYTPTGPAGLPKPPVGGTGASHG